MRISGILFAASLLFSACLADDLEDGSDDAFTGADGKADGLGLSGAEEAGVLAFVNQATKATLKNDVGLSDRVADNITTHRAGADSKLGTADDDAYDDLAELDAVPYVGKRVFAALVQYAKDHGFIHDAASGFCKTEHTGSAPGVASVAICDALYDAAPFVHVPADSVSGSTVTIHGAVLGGLGLILYTADGRQFVLASPSGESYGISRGPAGFKAPQNLFAIYAVTGTKATISGQHGLKVSKMVVEAWVPGKVSDQLLLGTWEAMAARHVGDRKFDASMPVPFRFTLATTKPNTAFANYAGTDGLVVAGSIDNFDSGVRASDGTCLTSLASLGAASPFDAATANLITLWRHPNMHGLNDQVIVMDYPTGSVDLSMNGMGWIGPFSLMGLISEGGPAYGDGAIYPHATPTGHKVWGLKKVTSGGEACP